MTKVYYLFYATNSSFVLSDLVRLCWTYFRNPNKSFWDVKFREWCKDLHLYSFSQIPGRHKKPKVWRNIRQILVSLYSFQLKIQTYLYQQTFLVLVKYCYTMRNIVGFTLYWLIQCKNIHVWWCVLPLFCSYFSRQFPTNTNMKFQTRLPITLQISDVAYSNSSFL